MYYTVNTGQRLNVELFMPIS